MPIFEKSKGYRMRGFSGFGNSPVKHNTEDASIPRANPKARDIHGGMSQKEIQQKLDSGSSPFQKNAPLKSSNEDIIKAQAMLDEVELGSQTPSWFKAAATGGEGKSDSQDDAMVSPVKQKTKTRKNILTGRKRTVTKSKTGKKTIVVTDRKGNVRKEKTKTKGGGITDYETKKYKKDGTLKSHIKIKKKKEHITGHGYVTKRTKTNVLKNK